MVARRRRRDHRRGTRRCVKPGSGVTLEAARRVTAVSPTKLAFRSQISRDVPNRRNDRSAREEVPAQPPPEPEEPDPAHRHPAHLVRASRARRPRPGSGWSSPAGGPAPRPPHRPQWPREIRRWRWPGSDSSPHQPPEARQPAEVARRRGTVHPRSSGSASRENVGNSGVEPSRNVAALEDAEDRRPAAATRRCPGRAGPAAGGGPCPSGRARASLRPGRSCRGWPGW